MFHKDEILTLDITEVNNLGCGVGRQNGIVVFVKGAVTGDRVTAKIIKTEKNYCVGRLENILTPSPYREKKDPCVAPEACGGCVYRHVTYAHESEMKKRYVENAFRRAGLSDVTVEDVRSTGETSGYRNKAQYPFGLSGGKVRVGFYANRTHKVMPCESCALQPRIFEEICRFVCEFADEHGYTVYNEETGKGLLRHLYLRIGKKTGEVMVCLVINGDRIPEERKFAEELGKKFHCVKSMMLNRNERRTSVILGEDYRTVAGHPYIEDILCGKRFRIAPAAFYQVNHDGAELLYRIAAEKAALADTDTLLDLYCGIGTIGISIADVETHVVGVEIVEDAVKCARKNAEQNGLKNAEFFCGDAGDVGKAVERAMRACTDGTLTVIVDPPRRGLDMELICCLAEKKISKIVYVSCNPDTLARDCAGFRKFGYSIGEVTPVDMFPKTGHVETVVLLSMKSR